MIRTDLRRGPGRAARLRAPAVLGGVSLLLGACNSILGITIPVDLPVDAASDNVAVVLPDAGPDIADAGTDRVDATRDGMAEEGTDAGPDSGEAGSNADASDANQRPLLMITPATLPDARFNVAYDVTFRASGSGAPQSWTISAGTLPPGLQLGLDGTLYGVPVQEGVFPFDVSVSEAPPGTGTGASHVTLTVVRKYWLAYHANPEVPDNYGVFAIDLRSPSVQRKVSSNFSGATGLVGKFGFSPDGKYLAFLGYSVGVGLQELYVVDMSGDTPGTPRQVNEYGVVNDFAWSPEGRYLAFDGGAGSAIAILVADMTQPQAHPVQAATKSSDFGINDIGFVTSDLLTFWTDDLAFTQRLPNQLFAGDYSFTFPGALVRTWPELESGLFESNYEGCQDPFRLWSLIDFHPPVTIRQLVGDVSVSPGRDFIAHRESSDYQYKIYSIWGTDPIVTFPSGSHFCAPGSWSHDGSLFVAGGDDDTLQVTRITGAAATTGPLPGTYGTVAEIGPPLFSPDDHWLGFSTNQGPFVVKNDHGSLGDAISVGVPVDAPFGAPRIAFSPDSAFMASADNDTMTRAVSITLADLRHGLPTTLAVTPSPPVATGSSVHALGWSSDSGWVAFIVKDGPNPTPVDLYVVPSNGNRDPSRLNVTKFPPCDLDPSTCRSVDRFEFQP
jgi:WD40 repeat protein